MGHLFYQIPPIHSTFGIKHIADLHGNDAALVGSALYDTILARLGPLEGEEGVFISIASTTPHPNRKSTSQLRTISCYASRDDGTTGLAIPPTWTKLYRHIFSPNDSYSSALSANSVSITPTRPILLSEVIVAALSNDAYELGSTRTSLIEDYLSQPRRVLRQGDVFTISSAGSGKSRFKLVMVQPVLQGYAKAGHTRFVLITADTDTLDEDGKSESSSLLGSSEDEGIEINEEFLADSRISVGLPAPQINGMPNGTHHDGQLTPGSCVTFKQQPLSVPFPSFADDYTLAVRTADLGRVGTLSGDWAIVSASSPSSSSSKKQRLARVIANDDLVDTASHIAGPPALLHNICSDQTEELCLRPAPLPSVPTVKSITIARIASKFATEKKYQTLFLSKLKHYFDGGIKRLVKVGDVIPVEFNTDMADRVGDSENAELDATVDLLPFSAHHRANQVVYFLVTNMESESLHGIPASEQDASTIGELGCWIDSTHTKMIQTGVEHSIVPDLGTYIGADPDGPQASLYYLSSLPAPASLLSPSSPYGELYSFVAASLAPHTVSYDLALTVLLKGARGSGKFTTISWVAQRLGMHIVELNCYDAIDDTDVKTEANLRVAFEKACECSPCVLVLRHVEALVKTTQPQPEAEGGDSVLGKAIKECLQECRSNWRISGYPVVVVGTSSDPEKIPASVVALFKHDLTIKAPSERERFEILSCLLDRIPVSPDASLANLATQTAALVASDLVNLVTQARCTAFRRASKVTGCTEADLTLAGIPLTAEDFEAALGNARASYSESVGAPKIPNVTWDDVGGLAHVKADILDTIQLPLEHPELFADGLKQRSGILLYGPPGTGKTLLAKAVATSCSLNFFSVKGPELLNMYIGESEANVRRVFQKARDAIPCVIFFDELDSVAPKRGNQGDSGGVMDRIVSQLLAELDGMSSGEGGDGDGASVFVMGATNRPDLLDPALLRPGRFDRMLYLGVSDTHKAQQDILEALTRKFRLDPGLSLKDISEKCPFNYTGADFYALCSDAMLNAMSRKAEELEDKIAELNKTQPANSIHPYPLTPQYYLAEMATTEEIQVLVNEADFERALRNLVPSVSVEEMEHYKRIQGKFSQNRVADVDEA